jgi:Protein of unknown function (DUF2800)
MKVKFLSPSKSHRWFPCPGSVAAEAMAPIIDGEGGIALEGSAAHKLFELCLKRKVDAEVYLSEDINLTKPKAKFTVTEDMVEHIQDGVDLVHRYVGKGTLWTEQTVNYAARGVQSGGTLDAAWHGAYPVDSIAGIHDKNYKKMEWQLHVMDLKYGYLAVTAPSENKQIKIYAAAKVRELLKKGKKVDSVHLWIYQPRLDSEFPFRHDIITPFELAEFEMELDEAIEATKKANAPRHAGSHCLYCAAHPVCKEAERATMKLLRSKYDENDTGRVGQLLMQLPMATAWIKALKALGTTMGLNGSPPLGFIMGAGRRTKRWNGDKEKYLKTIGPKLRAAGLKEDEYAPRKLVSPAKAMGMANARTDAKRRAKIEKLWFWTPGKPRLQPEENARAMFNASAFFDSHDSDDGQEE